MNRLLIFALFCLSMNACLYRPALNDSLGDCKMFDALSNGMKGRPKSFHVLYLKQDDSMNLTLHAEANNNFVTIAGLSEFGQKLFVAHQFSEKTDLETSIMWRHKESPALILNYLNLYFYNSSVNAGLRNTCNISIKKVEGENKSYEIFSGQSRVIRLGVFKDPSGSEVTIIHDFMQNAVAYISAI